MYYVYQCIMHILFKETNATKKDVYIVVYMIECACVCECARARVCVSVRTCVSSLR